MKPKSTRLFPSALFVVIATAATTALSFAASDSWSSAVDGNWSDTGKWAGNSVPDGSAQTATFNQNWTGQVITVDGSFTVGSILASDTSNNGGLLLSGGNLTLDNGVNKPIIQTSAGFTEPGGTTPFNNPLRITTALAGSNGFEKTGAGYLSLEAANTFTGSVKLTAPAAGGNFLRLTNDNNLGDAGNDIEVVANAGVVGLFASTGFNVVLNSGRDISTSSTTGTQDFWLKTKGTGNITVEGVISGATRLRKNDSGIATLTGANTFTGNTYIEGGTLVLSGGNNRLLSGSTITMGNSAGTAGAVLEINGGSQTVNGFALITPTAATTNTVRGTGSLILQGTGNYSFNTGFTSTSLNMADLAGFTLTRASNDFDIRATGSAAAVTNTVNLAKTGTNTISANNVFIGQGGASTANQQLTVLGLGQTNIFNVGTELAIGNFQGSGSVAFQAGLTNATLTLRGASGGSSALPNFRIGRVSSGNTFAQSGTLDLTNGIIDAIVTNMSVGYQIAGASTGATGTFTMPAGTIVADVISVAHKTNTGNPTINGTINQSGGSITAATVNLGHNEAAGVPNLIANYNLTGGTLYATTIQGSGATYGGSTVRNLTINGGTLRNLAGGDLSVNGLAATATGRINVIAGASGATFNADANRTITLGANTVLSGGSSNAITKSGDGTLLINGTSSGYTGTLSVNAGTLGGATSLGGNLTVGASGKLAPGASTGTIGTIATKGATWTAGSIWEFDLSAGTPGSSDLLSIDGNFTKAGTGTYQFNFMDSSPTVWGATYTLVSWTGTTDFLLSNFSYTNLGGAYDLQPGTGFSFGVDGKSLVFTAVPEPTSALAGLLLGAGLLRRRRK